MMSEQTTAEGVDVHDDGNPRTGVHVTAPVIARLARPGVIIGLVLTGLLTMLSMTILVAYLAPSVERLTQESSDAADQRDELLAINKEFEDQLTTLLNEQREERLVDDCLTLYRSDIEVAKGVAQVTLGDNLASAILDDDPGTTNEQLAQEVLEANTALRDALAALEEYLAIDPPPEECPHPSVAD